MNKILFFSLCLAFPLCLVACKTEEAMSSGTIPSTAQESETVSEEETDVKMTVDVNSIAFTATLEENAAVDALVDMMEKEPVTIRMSDYAGFEKVGSLDVRQDVQDINI